LGGIVASLVLLRFLSSVPDCNVVVLILNLSMAAVLLLRMRRTQLGAAAVVAALFAIFLFVDVAPWLDRQAQALVAGFPPGRIARLDLWQSYGD
jgi:hypothetical protein